MPNIECRLAVQVCMPSERLLEKNSTTIDTALRNAIPGRSGFDTLIVGAGFAGSVLAERLANVCGQRVLICD